MPKQDVPVSGAADAGLSPLKRAYLALEALQARCRALEEARAEPVAVVGMACRLPGGADTPDNFWSLLRSGTHAVAEVPPGRWDAAAYFDPDPDAPGRMCTQRGGYLSEPVDAFDPQFFGISPREAETMDPQQRLLLEVAWEALENAAQVTDRLAGSDTGVFVGITSHDYADFHLTGLGARQLGAHTITGNTHNAAAGRLSYCFGFQGPCMAVDTACSSSLVAVHLACRSLLDGECRRALAGGVNLILSPIASIALSQGRVLAPDGTCRAFDAAAAGMVRGEGCAVLVLKRLSDARQDRDNILAVIRGSAINQDGPSSGLTVPNGPAQEALVRRALLNAGLGAADVDYIEAHGTGTLLGDPIELRALASVFAPDRTRPLVVGSVKTNIGHLEACAGLAGLLKVILALQHGEIPPHLHFQRPTPHLDWAGLPFTVPTTIRPWPSNGRPRSAGVSSFGFSGVNAHVVLGDAPAPPAGQDAAGVTVAERPLHVLALSGRSERSLAQLAQRYIECLSGNPGLPLEDVCHSANTGRLHAGCRLAIVAASGEDARAQLGAFLQHQRTAQAPDAPGEPRIAFLFSGQGSQRWGMARELYETQPTFRRRLRQCSNILSDLQHQLLEVLYGSDHALLDRTEYAQPALFAVGYALAELWQSWGVRPTFVMGHSLGEYVAACVAGVFSVEDGLRLVAARGRLMQALPQAGGMLAVFAPADLIEPEIRADRASVAIAAYNGPENLVISGCQTALAGIAGRLRAAGIRCQPLRVSHAFHSPLMEPVLDAFAARLRQVPMVSPRVDLISNVSGEVVGSEVASPQYWLRHLREPVRFGTGIATAGTCDAFLEIGPQPTLLALGQASPGDRGSAWLPSLRPGVSDWQQMLESLSELYRRGAGIDWRGVDRDYVRRRVALPTTPFQRQRCWPDASRQAAVDTAGAGLGATGHPLLGARLDLASTREVYFQSQVSHDRPVYLQDHRVFNEVVVPAAAYLEMAVAAVMTGLGWDRVAIRDAVFQEALHLPEAQLTTLQTRLQLHRGGNAEFEIHSRADGNWVRHVTGRLSREAVVDAPSLPEWRGAIQEPIEVEAIYRRAQQCGVKFGDRFRLLRGTWRHDTAALGEIGHPAQAHADNDPYRMHPAMLDAALQVIGAVFADQDGADTYLPLALDRLQYLCPIGAAGWARAQVSPGEHSLRADIQVLTADGRPAVVLEGLHLQRVERLGAPARPAHADWLYAIDWQSFPGEPPGKAGAGRWIVLGLDGDPLTTALTRRLERQGDTVTSVRPGTRFASLPGGEIRIDPREAADYRRLLEEQRQSRPTGIVQLWAARPAEDPVAAATLGWQSALHLMQATAAVSALPLWLVTRGAQFGGGAAGPGHAPLWGLTRAANLEQPERRCCCIDLDGEDDDAAAGWLIDEIYRADPEDQLAFRAGVRHVARLVRRSTGTGAATVVSPDGTYLVTGGLGGLGFATACWLVESGARSLLLVGRSPAPADLTPQLEALRRDGARVEIVQADIADAEQVGELLALIERRMPPLRGIFHAAGVLDDGLLGQQTPDRFHRVLAPKALGAWHLHRLTQGTPLDCFVLYSSFAALVGSVGQSSYAAANAFLDALAHHRHALGLPALSINWGAWAEVGMTARSSLGSRLAEQGLGGIQTADGLRVLAHLLATDAVQIGVAPVDWRRFAEAAPGGRIPPLFAVLADELATTGTAATELPQDDPARALRIASPDIRQGMIVTQLRLHVAQVLGLTGDQVGLERPLSGLGLDSLMAVELRNRVRAHLGIDVPLVRFMADASISVLASELGDRFAEAPDNLAIDPPSPASGALAGELPNVDDLNDEEVDALLATLLAEEASTGRRGAGLTSDAPDRGWQ
jgi:acyl transferase domain-containing protein